jgi:DNA polymerase elongation subunit (family B)
MKYIIHIETAPLSMDVLLAKAPVFKAASNLKDAAKIVEDIAKKKNKYIEDAAFNEATAHLCAISLTSTDTLVTETLTSLDKTEEQMLCWLYDKLKAVDGSVTFRGSKFVYPFLCRRGAIYGINFFIDIFYIGHTGRLMETWHIDLAKMWACGSLTHPESLQEITDVLDIAYKQPDTPYHKLLIEERFEEAAAQLACEVATLAKVHSILTQ